MDYGFLQDPHLPPGSPQQRPLTVLTMLEDYDWIIQRNTHHKERRHTAPTTTNQKVDHYQRIRE